MNMIAKEEEEEVVNVTEIDEPTQLRTLWVQPGVREINVCLFSLFFLFMIHCKNQTW